MNESGWASRINHPGHPRPYQRDADGVRRVLASRLRLEGDYIARFCGMEDAGKLARQLVERLGLLARIVIVIVDAFHAADDVAQDAFGMLARHSSR